MDTKDIIVGQEGCPVSKVASLLKSSTSFHLFHDKWTEIAMDLETPRVLGKELRRKYLQETIGLTDIMCALLEEWVTRKSREATLQVLVQVLEDNGLKDCSELLMNGIMTNNKPMTGANVPISVRRTRKYCGIPPGLQEFIRGHANTKFCIVLTPDNQITCDKMSENVPNCCVHKWKTFTELLYSDERMAEVVLVPDCTLKNLELLGKVHGIGGFNKVVFLTNVEISQVKTVIGTLAHENVTVDLVTDDMSWDDLTIPFQTEITDKLKETYGIDMDGEKLEKNVLVDLIKGVGVKLFKDTIPEDLKYYVERRLCSRHFISPSAIFKLTSKDIFLFTGIERYDLSKLAGNKMTYSSGDQVRYGNITGQYMLLEQTIHFERICSKTEQPVHLLRYEDGKLRWIKSRGLMMSIQNCLAEDYSQVELTEEGFCLSLASSPDRAVCVSDSPGMGKSVLLANIGRRLEKSCPDRLIIFLAITEFINNVKVNNGSGIQVAQESIEAALMEMVCENSIAEAVLKSKLSTKSEDAPLMIELLLDGFDELSSTDFKLAHEILQAIKMSFMSVRIWVTSRPHLLHELEEDFALLGYNIQPFSQVDQIQFLTSFWQQDNAYIDVKRLHQFARHCLDSLNGKMKSKGRGIAGIPLQCLLIGEVYKKDALAFAEFDKNSSPPFPTDPDSITNLYLKVIDKKLDKYIAAYKVNDFDKQSIMDMHVHLSLITIFPEHYPNLKQLFRPIQMTEILKIGIVESTGSSGSHKFIHRTFAEFYIAWYITDRLRSGEGWGKELTDFVLKGVFEIEDGRYSCHDEYLEYVYFAYPVITYFFDSLIADHNDFDWAPTEMIRTYLYVITEEFHMGEIAYACARKELVHILKFLERAKAFEHHASEIFNYVYLVFDPVIFSLEVLKFGLAIFEQHHEFGQDTQLRIIRAACHRGSFNVVEYLVKEKGLLKTVQDVQCSARLLHSCVEDTNWHRTTAEDIERRVQMMRMFVNINPRLLEELDHMGNPPLLSNWVDTQLLIELIKLGAIAHVPGGQGYTVLHQSYSLYISETNEHNLPSEEYHLLLQHISDDSLRQLFYLKNKYGKTPLSYVVQRFDPTTETLAIFKKHGADFNSVDDEGYPVLYIAVKYGRNVDTLRNLIKHGSNIDWMGSNGDTLLHEAALAGNGHVFEFLINECGLDVNAVNKNGLNVMTNAIKYSRSDRLFGTGVILQRNGAKLNDKVGHLLHDLTKKRKFENVRLLLHLGVDANSKDELGNSPLHYAVEYGERSWKPCFEITKLLIKNNADPNSLNAVGETPYHIALKNKEIEAETIQLLKSKTDLRWTQPK